MPEYKATVENGDLVVQETLESKVEQGIAEGLGLAIAASIVHINARRQRDIEEKTFKWVTRVSQAAPIRDMVELWRVAEEMGLYPELRACSKLLKSKSLLFEGDAAAVSMLEEAYKDMSAPGDAVEMAIEYGKDAGQYKEQLAKGPISNAIARARQYHNLALKFKADKKILKNDEFIDAEGANSIGGGRIFFGLVFGFPGLFFLLATFGSLSSTDGVWILFGIITIVFFGAVAACLFVPVSRDTEVKRLLEKGLTEYPFFKEYYKAWDDKTNRVPFEEAKAILSKI